jgi:anti-anti-sigma regulatory factor
MAIGTVILNCAQIQNPGVAAIDYLARLKLGLKRGGCELCLAHPGPELKELIELAGLSGVLVEVERQPEEREQPGGVEKEGELADPPV